MDFPKGTRHIAFAAAAFSGVLLAVACCADPAAAQDDDALLVARRLERAFVAAIQRAEKSVVSIARFRSSGALGDLSGLPPQGFVPNEFGSGVLITDGKTGREPLVLTNYHVVRGGPVADKPAPSNGSDILIWFHDRRRARAAIIAADPRSDLAVLGLKLEGTAIRATDLTPFRLRTVSNLKKGQLVLTLGNPYAQSRDGSASAGWGIISNIARRPDRRPLPETDPRALKQETIHHFGTLLQIDARLNLGSSGGAVLNLDGELIGITTSLAALDGYEKSVGYAIPFDRPTGRIIESLIEGYEAEYGFLGIGPATATAKILQDVGADVDQPTAAFVAKMVTNSPADDAGLSRGDVILSVNEARVYDQYDLMREVALLGPAATARLRVWRARERRERTIPVKLGKWPVVDDEGIIATQTRIPAWRGLMVDYPTARAKHLPYDLDRYHRAVLVVEVAPDSPAARRQGAIKSGQYITHVDDEPVTTPAEFHNVVSRLTGSATLQLADGNRVVISPR